MEASRWYRADTFETAVRLAKLFPRTWVRLLSTWLGRLVWRFDQKARRLQEKNLSMVSGLHGADLDRLCRENFESFVRGLGDYCVCASLSATEAGELMFQEMGGREHMESVRQSGRGAVLATAHFGNWELGSHLMAWLGYPLTIVTLKEPNNDLDAWRRAYRSRIGVKTITIGEDPFAFVEMFNTLKSGGFLAMLADRPQSSASAEVNWLGGRAAFSTGPALLAAKAGVPVIPVFICEGESGRYRGIALPPVAMEPGDSADTIARNTQALATAMEAMIRSAAGQCFNYAPIFRNHV